MGVLLMLLNQRSYLTGNQLNSASGTKTIEEVGGRRGAGGPWMAVP